MFFAIYIGDVGRVGQLLDSGANLGGLATPLHCAVEEERIDVAKALIEGNADVSAQDGNGRTPLHTAVANNGGAVITPLPKHGADLLN
jgi:ankyrin repeat protein